MAVSQRIKDNAKRHRDKKRALWQSFKDSPCVDCGVKYPPHVMDFDHVRGEKKFTIANLGHGRTVQALLDEIEKCDIVCANCHRVRTWNRNHGN